MSRLRLWAIALAAVLAAAPGFAQGTTGSLAGIVTDQQGAAVPGVAVSADNTAIGLQRSTTTDTSGSFIIHGLPVGSYELKVEIAGFSPLTRQGVAVNVGATTALDLRLRLASQSEEVTVVADAPLIDAKESGVGEIVTSVQIENLPLNGRQFGNLAALVPGVGLGYHPDPTKSTQFAPQVAGGTGRNINYLIDGGDNNDDTVGGMVQNFPLDSVGQFNFVTQRFKAEYGRSYGGVLQVVTKSGTNDLQGSLFNYFRDKSLNARTEQEKLSEVPKGDYRKYQFGGSLGGPIKRDKTHFFASVERVQQDTTQAVDTLGLFPEKDGVFDLPFRETLGVGKITHQLTNNYLSVRYGYNTNSQPYGASPQSPPEHWGTSKNTFHSANLNLNSVLSGGNLNEFLFQYSYFHNHIGADSNLPTETFPSGVAIGQNGNTPQDTLQHKYQFRDDFTWNSGRHELKVGVMFINEPTLDVTFSTGQQPTYTHLDDALDSPISVISQNGPIGDPTGISGGLIPNKQYGGYIQDTWRVTDKLLFDIGVRYDLITGFAFDQSRNRIFRDLQEAGRAGRLDGVAGMEDFGSEPREDKNNIAPRLGFIYDARGDSSFVIRGGVGRYYDFPYTNATLLFPVIDSQSAFGEIYFASNSQGLRNPDGSLFRVGQPLPLNEAVIDTANSATTAFTPLPRQPYTDQANLGFSVSMGQHLAVEVDGMMTRGRDQGRSMSLNVRPNLGPRRFAGILPNVGTLGFSVWVPENKSEYKGVSFAFKKRWDGKTQLLASYTLSKARSSARSGTDEFIGAGLLDAFDPFSDAQFGPSSTDARHRVTISGIWSPGAGFTFAPIFRFRSKLPYNITAGQDLNRDNNNFDLPPDVSTTNAGRGATYKQLDLRLSKKFRFGGRTGFELIGEVFNLTNSKNPAGFIGNRRAANFGQATEFAGDFQRGEQRMAQLGVRLEF